MSGKKCSSSGGRVGGLWLGKNGYGWSQGKMENNNNNGKWKVCMCMEKYREVRSTENGEWRMVRARLSLSLGRLPFEAKNHRRNGGSSTVKGRQERATITAITTVLL